MHAPGPLALLAELDPASVEVPDSDHPFWAHVASYCVQHKTGNAVEVMTKFLGLLSPSYCLATVLAHGDTADNLMDTIKVYIARNLQVKDPNEVAFDHNDYREIEFQKALLEKCYVKDNGLLPNEKPLIPSGF